MTPPLEKFRYPDLVVFATSLFERAGLDPEKSGTVGRVLVEADLLGHSTHGLALLPSYVEEVTSGEMTPMGAPGIVADRPAAAVWDGNRLPGPWLVEQALDAAAAKARAVGLGAVAIKRSHHIACLAAFLERPARAGLLVTIASSDPSTRSVAPFGGTTPIFTPNPIAIGIPTDGDPVMIDISASITTNAMCGRVSREGGRLPGPWLVTADGEATDDPARLKDEPPAALLPTGGLDHGQKGYGLALTIEALTQGLTAYGRADGVESWGASVLVQAYDPALFGGLDGFAAQTGWLAEACRAARPIDPRSKVRLPGEAGLARKRAALTGGVPLRPENIAALRDTAARLSVPMPNPIGS